MTNKTPILSICIPTFKRVDITRQAIESIYSDLNNIDIYDFEVIISDNDPEESSRTFIDEFKYPNFHYYATRCEGFLNSFYVLGYGKGAFLKLHNNSSLLKKGSLLYLINQIKSFLKDKPLLFYTNGMLKNKKIQIYKNADDFFKGLSYFSSWSSGFGIWRDDYETYKDVNSIDKMFPQTSLLLSCCNKKTYVIDDTIIRHGLFVPKKGGYNPYKVFGEDFLNLFFQAVKLGIISSNTFACIKKDLFKNYLATRYLKSVVLRRDSFDKSNISMYLQKYYGKYAHIKLFIYSFLTPLFRFYHEKSSFC